MLLKKSLMHKSFKNLIHTYLFLEYFRMNFTVNYWNKFQIHLLIHLSQNILDEEKKEFWKEVYGFLKSDKFANILLQKFNISKNGVSGLFLHKDLENFEVKPHRDLFSKLVTYLFYLPEDSSLSQLGTHMLIPKKGVVIEKTTKHQDWELFETVKKSEYIPNSFFAFSPHENSFHAVKVNFPENAVKERDTIRGFVFDKDEKDYPEYLFGK